MTNYIRETDEQMRQKSNRTYQRILLSLSQEVARRFGYSLESKSEVEVLLDAAYAAKDWKAVAQLSSKLAEQRPSTG